MRELNISVARHLRLSGLYLRHWMAVGIAQGAEPIRDPTGCGKRSIPSSEAIQPELGSDPIRGGKRSIPSWEAIQPELGSDPFQAGKRSIPRWEAIRS
jgi:hypothetical protein